MVYSYVRALERLCEMKLRRLIILLILIAINLITLTNTGVIGGFQQQANATSSELYRQTSFNRDSSWSSRLYAPTYLDKINNTWFLVDCWHNRVLWSNEVTADISTWNVLDSELAGPHSISYGDNLYAVEDTGNHQIIFYERVGDVFERKSIIQTPARPHKITYDNKTDAFWALTSYSGEMLKIEVINKVPKITTTYRIPVIENSYTRSFTILSDGSFLITANNYGIVHVTFEGNEGKLVNIYPVPYEFSDLNNIKDTEQGYVITSNDALGYVSELAEIPSMKNRAQDLGFAGSPYYVSVVENLVVIPEIRNNNSINILKESDSKLTRVNTMHNSGSANVEDEYEKNRLPK